MENVFVIFTLTYMKVKLNRNDNVGTKTVK